MSRFLIFFSSLILVQCSIDRTILTLNSSELDALEEFLSLAPSHQVQISSEDEPGQKLWLCLTLVNKENQKPLSAQPIYLYHTSNAGEYAPSDPNDESTARLNGSVYTDDKGRAFVQTILPGDYGSSADNRHIHTSVPNAKPEAYDIHFKQYTTMMGTRFSAGSDQHFLADLKYTTDSTLVCFLTIEVKSPVHPTSARNQNSDCEWCGASEAPENVNWEYQISPDDEPSQSLILEGTIYHEDGETPAPNVIVYAYHTNAAGVYEKKDDETGNGIRHGYLRGWAKTNQEGKYRFYTIKPAPYPSRTDPAHVHMTLMSDKFEEYWINSTWFEGDSLITQEKIAKLTRAGGFTNIITLTKNENNIWIGKRNIIIEPPKK